MDLPDGFECLSCTYLMDLSACHALTWWIWVSVMDLPDGFECLSCTYLMVLSACHALTWWIWVPVKNLPDDFECLSWTYLMDLSACFACSLSTKESFLHMNAVANFRLGHSLITYSHIFLKHICIMYTNRRAHSSLINSIKENCRSMDRTMVTKPYASFRGHVEAEVWFLWVEAEENRKTCVLFFYLK